MPQDTVLFNEDIMYNLSYGKIGATQQEIEDAAKMADIHNTILDFIDGYKTGGIFIQLYFYIGYLKINNSKIRKNVKNYPFLAKILNSFY